MASEDTIRLGNIFHWLTPKQKLIMFAPYAGNHVKSAVDAHFLIDIVQMSLDRCQGDKQFAGNVCIAFPLQDLQDDLPFVPDNSPLRAQIISELICTHRGRENEARKIEEEKDSVQGIRDGTEEKIVLRRQQNQRVAQHV
jgi:hypothetical protein